MPDLLTFLALVAFVLVLAGLSEGIVSRAPLSFPMIFLGLGVVLGFRGEISLTPHSPMLEAVAVVTLSLVLFLDAVRIEATSARAARQLQKMGFDAAALRGGLDAWREEVEGAPSAAPPPTKPADSVSQGA